MIKGYFACVILCICFNTAYAQKDTSIAAKPKIKPFAKIDPTKPYQPGIAIMRSAIAPGWGQITNKKYWKLPLVYGALGTTTYLFFRNLKQYREARDAYTNATDQNPNNNFLIPEPYLSVVQYPELIKNFRNGVRQNVDYSVLFFILFWGLNVVDAAVDAHLKPFNVDDKLTLHFKAGYSPIAQTTGISITLNFGK
jgi:hypothetical protein